jgi:AbrB family looped-hinge helix DNA binding protein
VFHLYILLIYDRSKKGKKMQLATISSKFQISVPKKIREKLGIKPGQQFIFVLKGECLELVPKRNMNDIRGSLAHANTKDIRDRSDRK